MSTVPLVSAWESAEIIGEDLSKEMLEKARKILVGSHCTKALQNIKSNVPISKSGLLQSLCINATVGKIFLAYDK